jgi:flavin reductase ActVB
MTITAHNFKDCMSKWPTGVSVITTVDDLGTQYGFTANSFASVSLDPMLVSFCLSKSSPTLVQINNSRKLVVSLLSNTQENIARQFATSQIDKFLGVEYEIAPLTKCPYIIGSLGWMECELCFRYPGGDHDILVSKVISLALDNTKSPLIYFDRKYSIL